ncbi:hypothetical protein PsorP6_011433 [Peronosclerospora sorghi]|uniref:Uncharacterized protein n=1 Tax=Peronosclerospora sorghi TaxID=230839 RepID=A0ACC0WKH6_9STRA|nr:hypothetical protein PsorP6_011433 [Peronosclerospora sorghi]
MRLHRAGSLFVFRTCFMVLLYKRAFFTFNEVQLLLGYNNSILHILIFFTFLILIFLNTTQISFSLNDTTGVCFECLLGIRHRILHKLDFRFGAWTARNSSRFFPCVPTSPCTRFAADRVKTHTFPMSDNLADLFTRFQVKKWLDSDKSRSF